jgi:uncharacterized membrane protein YgaE (UPF0421/DUF939 family)
MYCEKRDQMSSRKSLTTLSRRGEILLDEAADRSRTGVRRRKESLLVAGRPILHTAVAAALAWFVATEVVGHQRPFFAPVAAVVTLGLTIGQRRRRALEVAVGVAVGIGIADALVIAIGTGTVQVAVVVALAMTAALLLGGGPLLATQAAVSGVLVATLQPPTDGVSFQRFVDALVGGASALLVATVLFPVDPVSVVRRAMEPVLDGLALALDEVAAALEARDIELAENALVSSRATEPGLSALQQAVAGAHESARLSLRPARARARLERYALAAKQIELAVDNVRVLARGATRAISLGDATPPALSAAIRSLADAARELDAALDDRDARERALADARRAAAAAKAALEQTGNMSALHLIGQVRSTAVDLMRALGVGYEDARAAVRQG